MTAHATVVSGGQAQATSGKFVRGGSAISYYVSVAAAATFIVTATPGVAFGPNEPAYARSAPLHAITSEDWQRFRALADKWRQERGITSSITKMVLSPSYQHIIAMGETAVPFILRELESEGDDPDHWFWALEMITGADPVPVQAYGDTLQMARVWLEWAKGRYAW